MWPAFQAIMAYLESINKIAYDKGGYAVYIWSPESGQKYKGRVDLAWTAK